MAKLALRGAKGTLAKGTQAKGTGGKKSKARAARRKWNGAGVPYSGGQSSGGSANSDVPF